MAVPTLARDRALTSPSHVDLLLDLSARDALERIRSATARELLPFVSASAYPREREKLFVAAVFDDRFRVWSVPSTTRAKPSTCSHYLSGHVRDVDGGSRLTGTFPLHPFSLVRILLPVVTLLLPWLLVDRSTGGTLALIVWSASMAAFAAVGAISIRRCRPDEEARIRSFLTTLFQPPSR